LKRDLITIQSLKLFKPVQIVTLFLLFNDFMPENSRSRKTCFSSGFRQYIPIILPKAVKRQNHFFPFLIFDAMRRIEEKRQSQRKNESREIVHPFPEISGSGGQQKIELIPDKSFETVP